MSGKATFDLGNFRKRPPMMFEGEWRALKFLKLLMKEGIWRIKYKEDLYYPLEPLFETELRFLKRIGTIEISWNRIKK